MTQPETNIKDDKINNQNKLINNAELIFCQIQFIKKNK